MTDSPPVDLLEDADEDLDYDVVVVGAGLSGLTAADELRRRAPDLKVLVVEAKDRVGGRTLTVEMDVVGHRKEAFDLGGQWVGHTQTHILDMLKKLNLETYNQYSDGLKWAQVGVSKPRPYSSTLPTSSLRHFGPFEVFDFLFNFIKIEFLVRKINPLNLFKWKGAADLDDMTVSRWARQHCYTRAMRDSLEVVTRAVYGVEANRLSMLFHLYYAKTAGNFMDLLECVGDGAQAMKVQGGTQQISERLAEPLRAADALRLNTAVAQIDVDEKSMTAIVKVYDTRAQDPAELVPFKCSRVILAIPPSQAARVRFEPDVPSLKRRLFDSLGQGNFIKFVMTFQTAFWREKGYSGEIVSAGRTSEEGEVLPVIAAFDACSPRGSPALVGFITEEYADQTREERCNAVVKDLMRFLGDGVVTQFIDYAEKLWAQEPFNGGCPVAYAPPGQMDAFQTIRDPFHSVHFAGTESSTHWAGYLSGAVQAGRRAAHEVLHVLGEDNVINYNFLSDSTFADNYVRPQPPSNEYDEGRSAWWRRAFFVGALCLGIFAYSKKYQLSLGAKAVRPAERAVLSWFSTPWP